MLRKVKQKRIRKLNGNNSQILNDFLYCIGELVEAGKSLFV